MTTTIIHRVGGAPLTNAQVDANFDNLKTTADAAAPAASLGTAAYQSSSYFALATALGDYLPLAGGTISSALTVSGALTPAGGLTGDVAFNTLGGRILLHGTTGSLYDRTIFQQATGNTAFGAMPGPGGTIAGIQVYGEATPSGTNHYADLRSANTGSGTGYFQITSAAVNDAGAGVGSTWPLKFFICGTTHWINADGSWSFNGGVATIGAGGIFTCNDIYTYRAGGTTGAIFLTADATRYLYYDGTKYVLNVAALAVSQISATTYVLTSGGGIGYSAGAGGTVSQASTKGTGVALNTPTGAITTANVALGASTSINFVVTNTVVAATDTIIAHVASGGTLGAYQVWCSAVAAGNFTLTLRNITAGSLTEQPVIRFTVIKSVSA